MSETRHTEGPWEYVPSTEHHGPYVTNQWGAGDICDCYVMSNPSALSTASGGISKPIHHQYDEADANARLIAAAPELLHALEVIRDADRDCGKDGLPHNLPPAIRSLVDIVLKKATGATD